MSDNWRGMNHVNVMSEATGYYNWMGSVLTWNDCNLEVKLKKIAKTHYIRNPKIEEQSDMRIN